MTIDEAIKTRHSVRSYIDKEIGEDTLIALFEEIDACNAESGLNIQLITNEEGAFTGLMARYGKFSGVRNYIALVGKKSGGLQEKAGYYGERIVLKAQQLGLNTCWVAASYSKGRCAAKIGNGEKLACVISLGYGANQGQPHKNKPLETLYKTDLGTSESGGVPDWFRAGMEAALLAPTAMNQQKFLITLKPDNVVNAVATGGFYSKIDLGIVKYHFEAGAGKENFSYSVSP